MSDSSREIDAALAGDKTIPRATVLEWIESARDLRTLSRLYRLTDQGYDRIQPELGKEVTCALIERYLLESIRHDVEDDEEIESRFDACMSLLSWLLHLLETPGTGDIIAGAARAITDLYLEKEEARYTIETAFLEHALETVALRPYFEHWSRDERLERAWKLCLEWGEAHPDRMRTTFRELRQRSER